MTSKAAIFLDSSFFKALIDVYDDFHDQALLLWEKIENQKILCVTSNYIIDESCTLIRTRCGRETLFNFRSYLNDWAERIRIIRVTVKDDARAWDWMAKDWSNLSFTDCVSFEQMKRLGIKKIASFDNHFKRAGFEIVS